MPFTPHKALIIGATSGIGHGMASRLAKAGTAVIVTGRREDRLQQFVAEHSHVPVPPQSYAFDLGKVEGIDAWVNKVTSEHPDIDCVLLNAGVQRGMDLTKPESLDWTAFEEELRINYVGYVMLAMAFVPVLQKRAEQSYLMFMSSGLALTPLPRVPGYSAAKAAAHHFVLSLRFQLQASNPNIKVVEIIPALVATELQDSQGATASYGRKFGMPLEKFLDDTFAGLDAGQDQIPVGQAAGNFDLFEKTRQEAMVKMAQGVSGMQKALGLE